MQLLRSVVTVFQITVEIVLAAPSLSPYAREIKRPTPTALLPQNTDISHVLGQDLNTYVFNLHFFLRICPFMFNYDCQFQHHGPETSERSR